MIKTQKPIKFVYIYLLLFYSIESTYRQDAYKIFDSHYYKNKYELYTRQLATNSCSIRDGPNCYFISKFQNPYPDVFEDFNKASKKISLAKIFLTNKAQEMAKNNKKKPLVNMENGQNLSFMLTFETFDYKTEKGDIYLPSEMILQNTKPPIKLLTDGKIRLRNYKEGSDNKVKYLSGQTDALYPANTFAITETNVKMSINNNFFFISCYARCGEKYSYKFQTKFKVDAFKNTDHVYTIEETLNCGKNNDWKKITGITGLEITHIVIPEGFEIDNIQLIYLSKNPLNIDGTLGSFGLDKHVQEKLNEYIKELVEKGETGVKVVNIEDIIRGNGDDEH